MLNILSSSYEIGIAKVLIYMQSHDNIRHPSLHNVDGLFMS
jgi:hypothetical protein